MSLDILVVCTANICRSPAAARALRVGLVSAGVPTEDVTVSSAGVMALVGSPMCEVSETEADALLAQWPSDPAARHQSRQLDSEIVNHASLILTADRQHRRSILMESPRQREKVFTLRQAGRLSSWLVSSEGSLPVAQARALGSVVDLDPLDPRFGVPPLPKSVGARLQWFCSEMDAARGLGGHPAAGRWPQWDVDDIGDPHVEGTQLHADSSAAAVDAALQIAHAIGVIYSLPQEVSH